MTLDVVAGAVLSQGTVLAARRRKDGRWEFPGGKLEPGESAAEALARELREELGVGVAVGVELARIEQDGVRLTLLTAEIVVGEAAPLTDHDQIGWLDAAGLPDLAWLPLDRRLLPAVQRLLR